MVFFFALCYTTPPAKGKEHNEHEGLKRIAGFSKYIEVLRKPVTPLLLLYTFLFNIGTVAPLSFIPQHVKTFGITSSSASMLLSIMGISNCVGKIVFGRLLDMCGPKKIYLIIINSIINSSMVIASDFLRTFAGQATYAAVFGFSFGGFIDSVVVLLRLFYDDITEMLGLWFLTMAVSSIVSPTFVGQMYDYYSSFTLAFEICGGLSLLGTLLMTIAFFKFKDNTERDFSVSNT